MIKDPDVFNQIAFSFAGHFECVYYVNIETGHYIVFADDDWKMNPDYVDRMIERMGDNDVASLGCGGVIGCFCIMKAKCCHLRGYLYNR